MAREHSIEDAVTFAISNEMETEGRSKNADERYNQAIEGVNASSAVYAEDYGYSEDEFRAELKRRGLLL